MQIGELARQRARRQKPFGSTNPKGYLAPPRGTRTATGSTRRLMSSGSDSWSASARSIFPSVGRASWLPSVRPVTVNASPPSYASSSHGIAPTFGPASAPSTTWTGVSRHSRQHLAAGDPLQAVIPRGRSLEMATCDCSYGQCCGCDACGCSCACSSHGRA